MAGHVRTVHKTAIESLVLSRLRRSEAFVQCVETICYLLTYLLYVLVEVLPMLLAACQTVCETAEDVFISSRLQRCTCAGYK